MGPFPVVAAGPTTFDELYRLHQPGLKRLAWLITGSDAVAEDLVHDVFVRSAARFGSLDDPASYLRTAVVNACRRHHRLSKRSGLRAPDVVQREPATADAIAVRRALMAMTPRRRAAVVLRYYADLSHEAIADTLGCRPATARSLVRRGLDDLRGALDEH